MMDDPKMAASKERIEQRNRSDPSPCIFFGYNPDKRRQ
jgi:hypothetical protein